MKSLYPIQNVSPKTFWGKNDQKVDISTEKIFLGLYKTYLSYNKHFLLFPYLPSLSEVKITRITLNADYEIR